MTQVQARTYTASLDARGLGFGPPLPAKPSSGGLHIRTASIRHGEQVLYAPAESNLEWFVLGNTAQARLNAPMGLVEHYEAGAAGMELTWVLQQPLRSAEELVVECEFTGWSYSTTTAAGHHWADAEGVIRARVNDARVVDASGRTWELPLRVAGNRLLATVSPTILSEAQYPQ